MYPYKTTNRVGVPLWNPSTTRLMNGFSLNQRIMPAQIQINAILNTSIGYRYVGRRTSREIYVQAGPSKKSTSKPETYNEALLQREQQLWDRQSQIMDSLSQDSQQLYNTLLKTHLQMQEEHAKERYAWSQREESLRQENSELRAQLLYALSQLNQLSTNASPPPSQTSTDDVLDGRAAAGSLPSPGGYQVKAAMDAVKQSSSSQQSVSPSSSSSQPSSSQSTWASELAAAIAAVDEVDILHQDVDYNAISKPPTTPPPPPPPPQQQQQSIKTESTPQQQQGPPPPLSVGADDIFWVNQLHTALVDAGFYPGDEDIDDFYYGESTQSAVFSFQACSNLPETGAVDDQTWMALLGDELQLKQSRDLTADQFDAMNNSNATTDNTIDDNDGNGMVVQEKPFAELFRSSTTTATVVNTTDNTTNTTTTDNTVQEFVEVTQASIQQTIITASSSTTTTTPPRNSWPTLIDGDGGRDVHSLHVALQNAGYSASEEDLQWWQFGDSTVNALKTFQACNGLPESGVCDVRTWKALLGDDATPDDLVMLVSGDSDDEDLGDTQGKVWLIGEQRWEDRSKLNK